MLGTHQRGATPSTSWQGCTGKAASSSSVAAAEGRPRRSERCRPPVPEAGLLAPGPGPGGILGGAGRGGVWRRLFPGRDLVPFGRATASLAGRGRRTFLPRLQAARVSGRRPASRRSSPDGCGSRSPSAPQGAGSRNRSSSVWVTRGGGGPAGTPARPTARRVSGAGPPRGWGNGSYAGRTRPGTIRPREQPKLDGGTKPPVPLLLLHLRRGGPSQAQQDIACARARIAPPPSPRALDADGEERGRAPEAAADAPSRPRQEAGCWGEGAFPEDRGAESAGRVPLGREAHRDGSSSSALPGDAPHGRQGAAGPGSGWRWAPRAPRGPRTGASPPLPCRLAGTGWVGGWPAGRPPPGAPSLVASRRITAPGPATHQLAALGLDCLAGSAPPGQEARRRRRFYAAHPGPPPPPPRGNSTGRGGPGKAPPSPAPSPALAPAPRRPPARPLPPPGRLLSAAALAGDRRALSSPEAAAAKRCQQTSQAGRLPERGAGLAPLAGEGRGPEGCCPPARRGRRLSLLGGCAHGESLWAPVCPPGPAWAD